MKQKKVSNIIKSFYISEDKAKTPEEKNIIIEINDMVEFLQTYCKTYMKLSKIKSLSKFDFIILINKTKLHIKIDDVYIIRKLTYLIKIRFEILQEMEKEENEQ